MFFTWFVIGVASVIFLLWRRYTFWARQGIKGPRHIAYRGFFMEHHQFIMESISKYGRVSAGFGLTGRFITINEPELIKEVWVKNFHVFPNHAPMNIGQSPKVNQMLFFMHGDQNWKRIRSIITPAFTSGKLKAMMSHISDISDNFVKTLEERQQKGKVVDMREYIGAFAMDVISACAYGIKIDSIKNPDHPVVQNAKKFFGLNANFSVLLSVLAPKLARVLKLEFFDSNTVNYFDKLTNQITKERKKINKYSNDGKLTKRTDFIQLMMDSEKSNTDFGDDSNSDVEVEQNNEQNKILGTLSPDEMTAQGILFFIAGYDTTSAALSHLVYYLSENKDCQQILYEELKDVNEFSYENLSRLKYLNAVIDETLRLAPSLLRIQRECVEDFVLKGIKIPKGTTVEVLPYALHRDPEYWPDPLSFQPERFLKPTHNQWAYLPFGGGHRLCVGQRFALNEMRMCSAKLFSRFEFSLVPHFKLEYFKGNILLSPKSVLVTLKARN